ncbi:hypothetical protein [Arthrobacter sp. 35W]|uniref:hypothetical protein n=1 Tax=Arthrobacter sp. 35W TaxID=1132441 RepID=UPI000414AE7F|nr:hypothetical protein [Arthrobacter sp. 35W]
MHSDNRGLPAPSIRISLLPDIAESVELLCRRTSLDATDLFTTVLRLYAADSRVGDDMEPGSGEFADEVDETILTRPARSGADCVASGLPPSSAAACHDAVWAYDVSRYNRGMGPYPFPGPLDEAAVSLLLGAGLSVLRTSDGYTREVLDSLRNGTSLVEAKEDAWREMAPHLAAYAPSALKKSAHSQYVEKLAQDPPLMDGWLARLTHVNHELSAGIAQCDALMTQLERDSEYLHLQLVAGTVGASQLDATELAAFEADVARRTAIMNGLRGDIDALIRERAFKGEIIDGAYGLADNEDNDAEQRRH